MRLQFSFIFYLLAIAFALTQDQIFQHDWQTVNIGTPFKSIQIKEKLISLSDVGILSILNATSGSVLYRYQSEILPLNTNSGIVELSEDLILNYNNFQVDSNRSFNSKLFLWNISQPYGIIEKEFRFEDQIISAYVNNDYIYVVDEHKIVKINYLHSGNEISTIYTSEKPIKNAKLMYSNLDNEIYALIEIDSETFISSLSNLQMISVPKCLISEAIFQQSSENLLICGQSDVYAFDSFSLQRISKGKNIITEKVSADSLIDTNINSFEIVDSQHVLIESDDSISLFNYQKLNFKPEVSFATPSSYYDSECNFFQIEVCGNITNVNLLTVSPSKVVKYFRNGILLWRNDQSFVEVKDMIIVDSELKSSLTIDELLYENSPNILVSYYRRLRHNYNAIFGKSRVVLDDVTRFGMSKIIVLLSENGKIGLFKMYKEINSSGSQLINIFNPPVKFEKLYEINRKIYGLSNMQLFEIDTINSKIHLMSDDFVSAHLKLLHTSESAIEFVKTTADEFYTSSFSKSDNTISGYFFTNDQQIDTWKFTPENEQIVSLSKRSYSNLDVAQNAIVLPDRSTLYKYLIPNVGVITTLTTGTSKSLMFYIVNLITGQTYGKLEKQVSRNIDIEADVHVSFEENFIIFTTPDKNSPLDSQLCSIDLFDILKPDGRLVKDVSTFSAFNTDLFPAPAFASQCFILPGTSITDLSISKTKHNIALKNILIRTGLGEVVALPKMFIDGRRNGVTGDFKTVSQLDSQVVLLDKLTNSSSSSSSVYAQRINLNAYAPSIESKIKYDPIITINPQLILTHHRKLINNGNNNGKSFLFTKPTELESTTYVVNFNGDLFVTFLRPSGSFDRLTSSFSSKTVIITIIVLISCIAIVRPRADRKMLISKWIL